MTIADQSARDRIANDLGTTLLIATHNQSLVDRFEHPCLHLSSGELRVERARKRSA